MIKVSAGALSQGLVRGLRGSRDDWGAGTEALCQFYEMLGTAFPHSEVSLPERLTPASMAVTIGTQLDWSRLPIGQQDKFVEGLALLRTIDEEYFSPALA